MFPNATMMKPQTWNDILAAMIAVERARWTDHASRRWHQTRYGIRRAMSAESMAEETTLNIGLIGYGFMGRTHSNAFHQAPTFLRPAVPAGAEGRLRAQRRPREGFADNWGYESVETDWRALVERKDIDADRHRQPERHPRRDRHRRRQAGKMVMCEKPLGRNADEAQAMVEAVEKAGVRQHGLVQLPPRAGRHAGQAAHRRGPARADLPLPRQIPAGLDDLADLPQGGEGLWRLDVSVAGSGVTGDLLAHCIDTALWLNGAIAEVTAMTETFIKERKHNLTGKVEPVGHRRRLRVPVPVRERLAGDLRVDPLRARPQGALHARDQRRARLGRLGPARPPPPAVLRPPRRRRSSAAGAASTSPTATIPT